MSRFAASFALLLAMFASPAAAAEPTPYLKFVGPTFVEDLKETQVTLRVMYDGLTDSNITTLYKNSKINIKDKVFLIHHDPAGQPGAPVMTGGPVMPTFALSLPKSQADAVLALKPGALVEITGTAHKSVFGMMAVRTVSLYVEGTSITAVPAEAPAAAP